MNGTIRNRTRNTTVARDAKRADSFRSRLQGMIGRRFGEPFDALIFERCNAIHTFFMSIEIDVAFADASGKICGLRNRLRPWRVSWCGAARKVVELPAGALAASETVTGDELELTFRQ